MKVILQDGSHYILRFDKGEEVIKGLEDFAEKNAIASAAFSGIGACSKFEIAYFNTTLKDYRRKPYLDEREIVSLTGNIALAQGKPKVHSHGVFADYEFNMLAGHVFSVTVSVTCEIHLTKLEGQMQRTMDEEFKLNLLA